MAKLNLNALKARIEAADVYALAKRTPCQLAPKLSAEHGLNIWLKREDLQDVFSFKIRGAANRIASLTDAEKAKGVCAASAGNHAQGMAAAAAHYKTNAVIFMPVTTPMIKVEAVQARGAQTRLVGDNYDAACEAAISYAKESGAVFIHPFDELDVIAGQGTVGLEFARQLDAPLDHLICCAGGGGLISGIALAFEQLSPGTKIHPSEPDTHDDWKLSLAAGTVVRNAPGTRSICDAILTPQPGELTWAIGNRLLSAGFAVSDAEVRHAVRAAYDIFGLTVEPGGAAALAAAVRGLPDEMRDKRVGIIVTGGNIDPAMHAGILNET